MVSQTEPKSKVTLKLLHEGKERTVTVTLDELHAEQLANRGGGRENTPTRNDKVLDGVGVTDLDPRARRQFNIPDEVRGALVVEVAPDSPAYEANLRPGDVILEINRQKIRDAKSAVELSKKVPREKRALLRVWSKGGSRFVAVEPLAQK
jgi:serine protease Do